MAIQVEKLRSLFLCDPETGRLTWKVNQNGRVKAGDEAGNIYDGRCRVRIEGKSYMRYRLVWMYVNGEIPNGFEVDHINRDPSDDRIANLRLATRRENSWNRTASRNNALGIKGVYFHKPSGKFLAQIRVNGKKMHIGYFSSSAAAGDAYLAASARHFGSFAAS